MDTPSERLTEPPRNLADRFGTVKWRNYDGVRNFRDSRPGLLIFFLRRQYTAVSRIYHFRVGCRASMATPRNASRAPTEIHGTLRNGKMAELRIDSGILGILGPPFCFPPLPPRLGRFRVFSVSALGVGIQIKPTTGKLVPTEPPIR